MKKQLIIPVIGVSLLNTQSVLAAAIFEHLLQPYIGTELSYDSNVLRLPNHVSDSLAGNKRTTGSFIKKITAGAVANWQFGQQKWLANVNINQNAYSAFNGLDYTGHDVLGQWKWQLGSRFKGELSYSHSSTLGSFQQINKLIGNLIDREDYIAKAGYEVLPDWNIHAGFTRNNRHYPSSLRQQSNLLETSQEYGVRYLNALDNLLDVRVTLTDGEYTNRPVTATLDNAYTRINYGIEGKWTYSVKTRLRGQLGYTSQTFKHLSQRNFADIVAEGDILWAVTSKSSLLLSAWRRISSTDDLNASFTLNQGVALTPTWTWSETPKVQIELPLSYKRQTSLGTTGFTNSTLTTTDQHSALSTARLNVNYTPIPMLELSAFMSYENRHSNSVLHSYQDQSVGLTMKMSF